jgi:hypothetical protein
MQLSKRKARSSDRNGTRFRLTGRPSANPASADQGLGPRSVGPNRFCEHVRSGRIDAPKFCALQFECYHCGFDQILDDLDKVGRSSIRSGGPTAA